MNARRILWAIGWTAFAAGMAQAAPYRPYTDVESFLATAEAQYPALCRRVNLGQTLQGRTLWALCVSKDVNLQSDEPEVCFISTMHGDEPVGTENLLNLITLLTTQYNIDSRVTNIVNNVELWIVPVMNPDGYMASTRGNSNGIDLNRNFPDPYTSPTNTTAGREAETAAIMNWTFGRHFTLAANFHTGSLVVNYPFDNNPAGQSVFTPSPDEDMFAVVSERYSQFNPPMYASPTFFHGITNGAAWYAVSGGMQDWAYVYMGCNEVTIELNNVKTPPASQLPQLWLDNKDSLLSYIEQSLIGVRGLVTDQATSTPLNATVSVVGRAHNIYTDPAIGDYHRMLLPGTYSMRFDSAGKESRQIPGVVVNSGAATQLDVPLSGPAQVVSPNGGEMLNVGQPANVTWTGHAAAQFQVQYTLNADAQSTVNEGFESGVLDPAFVTGGAASWFLVNIPTHTGTRSARAGIISHGQTSWMTRTFGGPGTANFWYRVSSESGHDYFNFYVDGAQVLHLSGTVAFTNYATPLLPAGSHELKWEYVKDASNSVGADTVWIDDLQIVTDNATWVDAGPLTPIGATSMSWTPPSTTGAARVRVRAFYDGTLYGAYDWSDNPFSVIAAPTVGDMNCDGVLNTGDIGPFVMALTDPSAYGSTYPSCQILHGDMDHNGSVDGADVEGFVNSLYGPP